MEFAEKCSKNQSMKREAPTFSSIDDQIYRASCKLKFLAAATSHTLQHISDTGYNDGDSLSYGLEMLFDNVINQFSQAKADLDTLSDLKNAYMSPDRENELLGESILSIVSSIYSEGKEAVL